MADYLYVGNGAGVPGLPHRISDDEAAAQGLTELLEDALAAGNYEKIGGKKKKPLADYEDEQE